MVDRFISAPLELSPALQAQTFSRVDLVFHGVDHSGDSYEGRVYINAPEADTSTGRAVPSYVGSFHVFGHGECFGDVGHCDVPRGPRRPFDLRPAHQLTPHTKVVIVTERLRAILAEIGPQASIAVTVVALVAGGASNEMLMFDEVRLLTYQ
jgi:tyrosinase